MKNVDVIVVGELNVDLIMNKMSGIPEESKEILAGEMTLAIGSSSAIFACNLSSLGAGVAFIGKTGKDMFGDFMMNEMNERNVDTSMIRQMVDVKTGATVVLNYGEDRANITHQGAMRFFSEKDLDLDNLPAAKHLHFSSYFLQPQIQEYLGTLFRNARAAGMTTSFDVQWDPHETWLMNFQEILPHVDVFLPNEAELLNLTHTDSIEQAIEVIRPYINIMVVKRGVKGSLMFANGEVKELPAFINECVVDAVGAGDSFNAGFIYKFIQQAPLEVCQEFGNLTGAISTREAGGTAAFKDIKNKLKNAMEQYGIVSA